VFVACAVELSPKLYNMYQSEAEVKPTLIRSTRCKSRTSHSLVCN